MTTTWIPQPNELVRFQGKLHNVVSVDLNGKCVIKAFSSTSRITKKIKNIDVSELTKIS